VLSHNNPFVRNKRLDSKSDLLQIMTSFLHHLQVADDTVWKFQMVFLPGTSCLLGEGGKTVECKLTSVLTSIKLKHLRHL